MPSGGTTVTFNEDATIKAILAAAGEGLVAWADDVVQLAKARVHVISGDLRANIGRSRVTIERGDANIMVGVDDQVDYAIHEERLHPYLRPAVTDLAQLLRDRIGVALTRRFGRGN